MHSIVPTLSLHLIGNVRWRSRMKRQVPLSLMSAFLVAVTAITMATPVAAATVKRDLVWGSGTRSALDPNSTAPSFELNASSNPDGSDPIGTFNFKTLTSAWSSQITCLNVKGSTATMVGRIATATGGFDGSQGSYFVQVVQDLGSATKRHPSPDLMSAVSWDTEAGWNASGYTLAQLCSDPIGIGALPSGWDYMVSGNLTVIDR
jgi:hypothetical protein